MNLFKKLLILNSLLVANGLCAHPVVVESRVGTNYDVDVNCDDSFRNVVQHLSDCVQLAEMSVEKPGGVVIKVTETSMSVKSNKELKGNARDFYALPTEQNQTDITFIITTLADANLIKIKGQESSLKKAGNRLDPLHPLQFLMYIFTEERLKVGMLNIQGRSFVWKEFLKGMINGLKEESVFDNIMPYAEEFASHISVNPSLILPIIKAERWENLIEALIKHVPRQAPSTRYDL